MTAPPGGSTMICRLSLGMERGIALDVNPIVRFCGHMTAEAVFLEVSRDLLIRRIGLKKSPTPAISPQWIIREPTLGVLDHDEPHLRWISSPLNIARGHLPGRCSVYLFNQDGAISKCLVASIVLSGSRRRVDGMDLVAFRI